LTASFVEKHDDRVGIFVPGVLSDEGQIVIEANRSV